MAEPCFLSDLKIYLGGTDLTATLNSCELTAAKAEQANGRFGDIAEVFFWGLRQVRANVSGFFEAGAGAPDPLAWSRIDPALTPSAWPLSLAPPSAPGVAGAEGNIAYTIVGREFGYGIGGQHGQLLPYRLSTLPASTYDLYRQTIDRAKATVTATTTSTGYQLGALSATQKIVAVLHVFAITGGSWVLTVQSDDNSGFTSATTRITFAAVTTAPSTEVKVLNGAVTDDWWRSVQTKTGGTDLTYMVALGIANIV